MSRIFIYLSPHASSPTRRMHVCHLSYDSVFNFLDLGFLLRVLCNLTTLRALARHSHLKMIKKRTRPQPRVREFSLEADEEDAVPENEEEVGLPYVASHVFRREVLISCPVFSLADIIELRKLRRAREGIDVAKLQKGDAKKKKKRVREEEVGGLQMGARDNDEEYVPIPCLQIDCQSSAARWRT